MTASVLSFIIFLPLVAVFLLILVPPKYERIFKWFTVGVGALQLAIAIGLWMHYSQTATAPDSLDGVFKYVEKVSWINWKIGGGGLYVDYHVGVDGISLPLVVLSTFILLVGAISSWSITKRVKAYHLLYLLLNTSILGCFLALDFFLFYLFFEFMLLPMFFLIGIWGGARRQYASLKFFIYTLVGSLLILMTMIGLYQSVEADGQATFNWVVIMDAASYIPGGVLSLDGAEVFWGWRLREWAFVLLLVGFLIKLPAVPLHTWLPDAHVEAPTAVSVVLAGLLLKVGGYGLMRTAFFMFPDVAMDMAYGVGVVAVASILYGGMTAMAQNDIKRLVAYSSVAHMGFMLLGLASITLVGLTGAVFQMVSHGFLSPALFLLVGVLYDRTHNRKIANFSGLAAQMPQFTFFVGLFFFASLGLPGMSGFIGELMNLMGAFEGSNLLGTWLGPLAVVGILVGAIYFLWTFQRMFFGAYWVRDKKWEGQMYDLTAREWLMLTPLAALTLTLGIFPNLLTAPIEASLQFWLDHLQNFAQP